MLEMQSALDLSAELDAIKTLLLAVACEETPMPERQRCQKQIWTSLAQFEQRFAIYSLPRIMPKKERGQG